MLGVSEKGRRWYLSMPHLHWGALQSQSIPLNSGTGILGSVTSPSFYRWEHRAKVAGRLPGALVRVSPSHSVAPSCSSSPLSGHTTNLALCIVGHVFTYVSSEIITFWKGEAISTLCQSPHCTVRHVVNILLLKNEWLKNEQERWKFISVLQSDHISLWGPE